MQDREFEQKTTATIAEAFDVMVESSGVVRRNADYLRRIVKPIIFIVVLISILCVALVFVFSQRDDRIERLENTVKVLNRDVGELEKAAIEARSAAKDAESASLRAEVASQAAKVALDESIQQAQRGGVNPEVVQAIQRINEIYAICVQQKEC